jgi:hypothetical protein
MSMEETRESEKSFFSSGTLIETTVLSHNQSFSIMANKGERKSKYSILAKKNNIFYFLKIFVSLKLFLPFPFAARLYFNHRYRKAKIDCLSLFMRPLLAQLKIGFFSSFSAAAVYSTNETNKAGLKQSIIFRCL